MQYLKKNVYDKIYAAAVEEFTACGYANASIRNIAYNAEVSVGNVYRYFTDKESLYLAIINPFIESVKSGIESGMMVPGTTTIENARHLVNFLMKNRDVILIICKGETSYYDKFVDYILDVASAKIKDIFAREVENIDEIISSHDFYNVITQSFVYSLFKILKDDEDVATQERKCCELITFYFGNLKSRFYHFQLWNKELKETN